MKKIMFIFLGVLYSTINTADHTKTSLSNESIKRAVNSFTEKPQPQKTSSPKRDFPHTYNRIEYQYFAQTIRFNPTTATLRQEAKL